MPLQPAYTWSETDTSIKITIDNVPIKDQSQLFCSDRVVKLNVPPYLLLLDLKHAVDDDRSTATITKGRKVVINLTKVTSLMTCVQAEPKHGFPAQRSHLLLSCMLCRLSQAHGIRLLLKERLQLYASSGRSLCSGHTRSW
jgi:hypothetical protein